MIYMAHPTDESTILSEWAAEICPGHPIDLGIVRAVKILRDAGFDTFEACEGGDDHAYAEPTVRFEGTADRGWEAVGVLASAGIERMRRLSLTWSLPEVADRRAAGQRDPLPFCEITFYSKLR